MEPRRRFRSVILFTADWHIKLGQKNVPISWACTRYKMFFEQLENIVMDNNVSLHIVGGDLFDRVPSMDELTLYFDFVKNVKCWTIIFDGNHEATRKNKTFFTNLKRVTEELNPHVQIITETHYQDDWAILPYADLHKKKSIEDINVDYLFTHVRGEIPPHVVPEVDLERFDKFKTVFAGDLHAHSNTQRNIVYPGSPMTTSFHRNLVTTGYILIKDNWDWTWHQFDLPQLLRKTVTNPDEMVQTDFHHTIYEIEGDVSDLSNIKNNDLLDKKVIKRKTEATLILDKEMTIEEELNEYLSYILELEENKTKNILGVFSDYAKEADVE
jgi:DNA repair exonuclease SbcCD nuclease subunit